MTTSNVPLSLFRLSVVLYWCSSASSHYKLVTYNAGLTPSNLVPEYKARKQALMTMLSGSSADVVCLQEAGLQQDILDIAYAARNQFPYYFTSNPTGTPGGIVPLPSQPPCQKDNFVESLQCAKNNCKMMYNLFGVMGLALCYFSSCRSHVSRLEQDCINCLMSLNTDHKPPDVFAHIQQQCLDEPTQNYETNYGLLLLSRHELKNKAIHIYHPDSLTVIPRGYLAAEIENLGPIVCTHLTTQIPLLGYFGPEQFTSYKQLHSNEVQQLLQAFPANQNGCPPVLMGDFNHGPAIAESQAYFADSFRTVLNAGYRSPYTEKSSQCTWCTSNPLVAKASLSTAILGRSGIIDHIYVQNERSVSGIEEVYKDAAAVPTAVGPRPISDHYGVQLTYEACNLCAYRGRLLEEGEAFLSDDGCSKCVCSGGQIDCNEVDCYSQCACGTATYSLTILGNFTEENHPYQYPGNARFSPMIVSVHSDQFTLWKEYGLPSDGVQAICKTGSTTTLRGELGRTKTGIHSVITTGGWPAGNEIVKVGFTTNNDYSFVSLISKLAPSPDWIIGTSKLRLCRGNSWVNEHHMDLTAYDCGTDNGGSYTSQDPSENITQGIKELKWTTVSNPSSAFYAQHGGVIPPYATLQLKLVNVTSQGCTSTKQPTDGVTTQATTDISGCMLVRDKKVITMEGCYSKREINVGKCVGVCTSNDSGQCKAITKTRKTKFYCGSKALPKEVFVVKACLCE